MNNPIWRYVRNQCVLFWRAEGTNVKVWACLIGLVFAAFLAGEWWRRLPTYVEIIEPNKAKLHIGGWFFTDSWHDLSIYRGRWYSDDGELDVPLEGPYSEAANLRFEAYGKVFLVDKKNHTKEEIKVVDGEWSYWGDGHWCAFSDKYVDTSE